MFRRLGFDSGWIPKIKVEKVALFCNFVFGETRCSYIPGMPGKAWENAEGRLFRHVCAKYLGMQHENILCVDKPHYAPRAIFSLTDPHYYCSPKGSLTHAAVAFVSLIMNPSTLLEE
jgi:hypothetical protein